MFSAHVQSGLVHQIPSMLGVRVVAHHDLYLGPTTSISKSKWDVFRCLKDRLWAQLHGWKEKFLSTAARDVFIKTVAQAIPNYVMKYFLLLVSFCDELRKMICHFWWGQRGSE